MTPEAFRSLAKVNSDECWLWQGSVNEGGYGRIRTHRTSLLAHRVSWSLFREEDATGLNVCHRCDVRVCVNPDHLFLGTHADNVADMIAKGRHRSPPGEQKPCAKLTERDIPAIRNDGRMLREIAVAFNVSMNTVSQIRMRKAWRHVP